MHVIPGLEVPVGHHPGPERHWKGMDFDHFVPRESVHKSADQEVLLTDARLLDDGRIAVAARWRRSHYLGHRGGAADPVLLAETARQTAIHLSHRFFGIGQGPAFVLSELSVDLDEALPPVGTEPLRVGLHVRCRRPDAGERRLRFELEADVLAGSRRFGRVRVCWEPMEPRRYAVVRKRGGGQRAEGAAGQPLHRVRASSPAERDVLVCGDPERPDVWWLHLDLEHDVLFDHETDHVPGMALVEAFRQVGAAVTGDGHRGGQVALLAVEFKAFGELDAPVSILAEPAGLDGTALTLRACQGDRELACARVRCEAGEPSSARQEAAC
ncbi:ScbA/BarX family gamma-butyrolactone biosynthesis protein [Streptomyces sp. NBC_00102]|uniref:ScbA/BarX family gamma-butyrolactone biosynthesis protein n=1 Tax=Streptomyces sp. NBC_00102 TaxID=2975652 RepID=UPI002254B34E|nr:ScbA/BarX family gamma-butyrolactone biosynthesis protein [Streptomyces sp. NBC_00102]MCX5401507.1 ScbA/BarX family gamma-butyrolactone biosynthesis protein [Streptomyces sp. NBC_00102]